jgi:putative chitinase
MNETIKNLQIKCDSSADGIWGKGTFQAAAKHFGLTKNRAVHFFAQCGHESGNFSTFSENLNYSEQGLLATFPKYFPNIGCTYGYTRNPEKIANKVYANRMGNGPENSGDGFKYRGRGAIQLTGKQNYQAFSDHIKNAEVMTNPDIVSTQLAFESALFFFEKNNLWSICDKGITKEVIETLTRKINGGTLGLDDRTSKTLEYSTWM